MYSLSIINPLFLCVPRVSTRNIAFLVRAFTFIILTLLFAAGPVQAQEGCCQVSESSCASPVTQTYCEETLNGIFQEDIECRTTTGKCGVLAGTGLPMPVVIALGLVFLALLGFLVTHIFIAKRLRKPSNPKY